MPGSLYPEEFFAISSERERLDKLASLEDIITELEYSIRNMHDLHAIQEARRHRSEAMYAFDRLYVE